MPPVNFTQEQLSLLIEAYGKTRYPVELLKKHPAFENVNSRTISYMAGKLNISRARISFSKEELDLMNMYAGEKTVNEIRRIIFNKTGRNRDYYAIAGYINKTLKATVKPDRYSLSDLTIGFRVHERKIFRWIRMGYIRAFKDTDAAHSTWRFRPINVAEFIIRYPFELEGCAVDVPWVVALIMEFSSRVSSKYRKYSK